MFFPSSATNKHGNYTAQNMIRVRIYPVCHLNYVGLRIVLISIYFHYLRAKEKDLIYMYVLTTVTLFLYMSSINETC